MSRPILEPPKWFEYAPPFLAQARVDGGRRVLERSMRTTLARAEERERRPRRSHRRDHRRRDATTAATPAAIACIDALATLAFDYPRRAAFFRGELKQFLLLAREQGFSPLSPKGSFAGAMGLPQFMPGSYRRYAVDFDGDRACRPVRQRRGRDRQRRQLSRAPRLAARPAGAAAGAPRARAAAMRSCVSSTAASPSGAARRCGPPTA